MGGLSILLFPLHPKFKLTRIKQPQLSNMAKHPESDHVFSTIALAHRWRRATTKAKERQASGSSISVSCNLFTLELGSHCRTSHSRAVLQISSQLFVSSIHPLGLHRSDMLVAFPQRSLRLTNCRPSFVEYRQS